MLASNGSPKSEFQCWYFRASQQVLFHDPGTDIRREMGYGAVSQPRTSGWPPCKTCAADGVHGDKLNRREKRQLELLWLPQTTVKVVRRHIILKSSTKRRIKLLLNNCLNSKSAKTIVIIEEQPTSWSCQPRIPPVTCFHGPFTGNIFPRFSQVTFFPRFSQVIYFPYSF